MPQQFWSLTMREFGIKHAAFIRAEDRAEAALMRQDLRTQRYKTKDRNAMTRMANRLKRYPVKSWLMEQ